jgi:predicted DNA binding CopG/RHH family protein
MPQALISRTVQLTQDEWQMVDDFKHEKHLKSWSKAFLAILAEWNAYRAQGRRKP